MRDERGEYEPELEPGREAHRLLGRAVSYHLNRVETDTVIVLAAQAYATLELARATHEGNSIDVDIAEAINTPGGILDALAPLSYQEIVEWAASLPSSPFRGARHRLLVGLAEIKKASEQ